MASFKDLQIWKKGIELVNIIYDLAQCLPSEEKYGLYSQITRSAVSIPSNIAEGQNRYSSKEFIHHLKISLGSCAELETQLIICQRRNYFSEELLQQPFQLIDEINAGTIALIKSINKNINR